MTLVKRLWWDSREKKERMVLFPETVMWSSEPGKRHLVRIVLERKILPFGDYCLASDPQGGVIETKRGIPELAKNLLTGDRVRFQSAWQRFVTGCRVPILVIEASLTGIDNELRIGEGGALPGEAVRPLVSADVFSSIWRLTLACPRLVTVFTGNAGAPAGRRRLGGRLVQMMLAAEYLHATECLPVVGAE